MCIGRHFGELHISEQGISDQVVSFLQDIYKNQTAQLAGTTESSRLFDIKRSVKQGCALSFRLFCAVLKMATGMWRGRVRLGLDTRVLVPNNRIESNLPARRQPL